MSYFHKKEYDWTVLHHMVAKPTISTSTVVTAESKDDKNFHWVYVMKKQPRVWKNEEKWSKEIIKLEQLVIHKFNSIHTFNYKFENLLTKS